MNEIVKILSTKLEALRGIAVDPQQLTEWIISHQKEIAVAMFMSYVMSPSGSVFNKLSALKHGKPSYQEIVPLNLSIRGKPLCFLNWFLGTRFAEWTQLQKAFVGLLGIPKFRLARIDEQATYYPIYVNQSEVIEATETIDNAGILTQQSKDITTKTNFRYMTCSDYIHVYQSGEATPVSMAKTIIKNIKLLNLSLNGICDWNEQSIIQQATASAERWKNGTQLSPLDGIPIVVKDHLPVKGLITRNGCERDIEPDEENCVVVQRVLDAGIIIIGISSMTQRGCSAIGYNPSKFHGTVRNAVNPQYYPGGSSSGTAAAVASGLVPFGIGTDGGGSIRIPGSFSGLVGIKPTTGRCPIMDTGLNGTLVVTGPLAGSVLDATLLYNIMSGPNRLDPYSMYQTNLSLNNTLLNPITGKTIGVDWTWAKQSDPEVYQNFVNSIEVLQSKGCTIQSISIPEIDLADAAHLIIFLAEEAEDASNDENPSVDNTLILNVTCSQITASDFVKASRYRTRLMRLLEEIFNQADIIASPGTANTAPMILSGEEKYGSMKIVETLKAALYTKMGNLAGQPSMVIPNGYDSYDLPTSIMVQSKWWTEETLINVAYEIEKHFSRKQPKVLYHNL